MTIELFLCDECAKRLESIFPEIDWITDNEQGTQEDIEYYLFLNKQLKHIEKCVVCNKNEITTRTIIPERLELGLTLNKENRECNIPFEDNILYIVAFCELRKEKRTFRVEGIQSIEIIK